MPFSQRYRQRLGAVYVRSGCRPYRHPSKQHADVVQGLQVVRRFCVPPCIERQHHCYKYVGVDYVKGVLPYEIDPDWPAEAQKAQAVCARSFALGTHKHGSEYDLCNTTNCQVYLGANRATETSDAAVDATKGETLSYNAARSSVTFIRRTAVQPRTQRTSGAAITRTSRARLTRMRTRTRTSGR